ncbi:MAG: teichuronic acid biosynthesis glycosyltransferase TuaH, partial [Pseudonocardiales bacterium]|nr:teichuronic acid biosynthesis glycosyltransferase TuaH [Pseudonocardiales bacterium]
MPDQLRAALLSLEPWDEVWRRNQHFAAGLLEGGDVSSLIWISPPAGGLSLRASSARPLSGVDVVEPP